ncbi:winged helix-turn-helix domain-containing protein [Streptomyces sp. CBMA123]|uniref:winged helix-turn-helix domain-containing protein n=1 Tax=Streptomyces sp. CBMA123 TaxID=1896313 RepID=UPI0016618CA4|nr:transcriptional regulator [Streptomyces sp. CBMA123]MBD0692990.1 MarR family transcriptional regulator [Streptomyces sp. CBMA123]
MTPDPPVPAFDELIHQPTRLAVVAFLSGCAEAEFRAVREGCGVSESALSKVAATLEAASYLTIRRGYVGKRPRTWLRLTPEGRRALASHLAELQRIAADATALGAALDRETTQG